MLEQRTPRVHNESLKSYSPFTVLLQRRYQIADGLLGPRKHELPAVFSESFGMLPVLSMIPGADVFGTLVELVGIPHTTH